MSQIIIGRNAVTEALKNNREIEKITLLIKFKVASMKTALP